LYEYKSCFFQRIACWYTLSASSSSSSSSSRICIASSSSSSSSSSSTQLVIAKKATQMSFDTLSSSRSGEGKEEAAQKDVPLIDGKESILFPPLKLVNVECPICMEPITDEKNITTRACGHFMHTDPCFIRSLGNNIKCPSCKRNLSEDALKALASFRPHVIAGQVLLQPDERPLQIRLIAHLHDFLDRYPRIKKNIWILSIVIYVLSSKMIRSGGWQAAIGTLSLMAAMFAEQSVDRGDIINRFDSMLRKLTCFAFVGWYVTELQIKSLFKHGNFTTWDREIIKQLFLNRSFHKNSLKRAILFYGMLKGAFEIGVRWRARNG
jgi:hypothetical protein